MLKRTFEEIRILAEHKLLDTYVNLLTSSTQHAVSEGLLSIFCGAAVVTLWRPLGDAQRFTFIELLRGLIVPSVSIVILVPLLFVPFARWILRAFACAAEIPTAKRARDQTARIRSSVEEIRQRLRRIVLMTTLVGTLGYTIVGATLPTLLCLVQEEVCDQKQVGVPADFILGGVLGLLFGALWDLAAFFRLSRIGWEDLLSTRTTRADDSLRYGSFTSLISQTIAYGVAHAVVSYVLFSAIVLSVTEDDDFQKLAAIGFGLWLFALRQWQKSLPNLDDPSRLYPSIRQMGGATSRGGSEEVG